MAKREAFAATATTISALPVLAIRLRNRFNSKEYLAVPIWLTPWCCTRGTTGYVRPAATLVGTGGMVRVKKGNLGEEFVRPMWLHYQVAGDLSQLERMRQ